MDIVINNSENELTEKELLTFVASFLSVFIGLLFLFIYCIVTRSTTPLMFFIIFGIVSYCMKADEFKCEFCEKACSTKKSLNVHLLTCSEKKLVELKEEVKNLKHKKDKKYKELDEKVQKFEAELESLKSQLKEKPTTTEVQQQFPTFTNHSTIEDIQPIETVEFFEHDVDQLDVIDFPEYPESEPTSDFEEDGYNKV